MYNPDRFKIEAAEKWADIAYEIPSLNFKAEWDVKVIPPFRGAVVRFIVLKNEIQVCSVYLDWFSILGDMSKPYWEVYDFDEICNRYMLEDTENMMEYISTLFNEVKL